MHALTLSSGHSLHYRDEGPRDGLTLVFSNSLGTDFRVWDPLLPHLPGGLRIVRYDKAGHGLSDFAGDRRIEDHAADLAELLAHLEIGKAVVIGLSVGGLIAQGLYHSVPERVAGLVFCDTADLIGSPEMWNDRIGQIEAKGIGAMADPILERWFTAPFRDGDATFPAWRNMLVRTPVEGYCAVARAIRDADFTQATPSIRVPTLCVVGTKDGSTPPELVRGFAERIPGAGFAEIPQCGHIPCVEQPEALALHLKKFLAKF